MITDAPHYSFSVEEYHKLGEAGILGEDDRIELLHGELLIMSPIGISHNFVVQQLTEFFSESARKRYITRSQCTLLCGEASELLPDLVLLRAESHRYRDRHPGPADVLLLIEVADESLGFDRGSKLRAYAAAGIPEYWIVNVRESRVEVHREPAGESFLNVKSVGRGDTLAPLLVESGGVPLADIFP